MAPSHGIAQPRPLSHCIAPDRAGQGSRRLMGTTAMSSAVSRLVPPAVSTIRREGSPARNDTARKTPAMPQNVPARSASR